MLKLSDNPPILSPDNASFGAWPGEWWVVHTKPRCEKALAWELVRKDIPYFLPMVRRTQLWGGRRRTVMHPLFASYLFLCGDRAARADVLMTGRTVNILPISQRDQFVGEIESLRIALESNAELNLYPFAAVGRRVRVCKGPLMGTVGTILQNEDVTRLLLQVSALGTAAELVIDAAFLEELS